MFHKRKIDIKYVHLNRIKPPQSHIIHVFSGKNSTYNIYVPLYLKITYLHSI